MSQFVLPLCLYALAFLLALAAARLPRPSPLWAFASMAACVAGLLTGLVAGLSLAQLALATLPVLAASLLAKGGGGS